MKLITFGSTLSPLIAYGDDEKCHPTKLREHLNDIVFSISCPFTREGIRQNSIITVFARLSDTCGLSQKSKFPRTRYES